MLIDQAERVIAPTAEAGVGRALEQSLGECGDFVGRLCLGPESLRRVPRAARAETIMRKPKPMPSMMLPMSCGATAKSMAPGYPVQARRKRAGFATGPPG